jgi:Ion channel
MGETKKDHLGTGAVRERARALITQSWQSQANLSFFLALLVTVGFILPSLGFGKSDEILYSDMVFSLLLISGVAIAWGQRWLFLLSFCVASATLAVRWMAFLTPTRTLEVWSGVWSLTAILVIALVLLAQVFRAGPVTSYRVQGAIAVYLLFGAVWAHAYHITAILHPGSFNGLGEMPSALDWAYYSYITLSTVGYGDITPVRPIARVLAMGEALTGQLYLAVLIARLVAMEVISWQAKSDVNSQRNQS